MIQELLRAAVGAAIWAEVGGVAGIQLTQVLRECGAHCQQLAKLLKVGSGDALTYIKKYITEAVWKTD